MSYQLFDDPTREQEDSEELNHIIHESRAAKRGLTWSRQRQRYETREGKPILFNYGGSWRVVTDEEWYWATADHDSHA